MDYLYSLKPNQTLSESIKTLSQFQIANLSYASIVKRGYNYFRDGLVYPNVEISLGKYQLEVSGNYGEYEVVIEQQEDRINASCDCPYEDTTCKHIIASLLHLQNNVHESTLKKANITAATIAKAEKTQNDFEKYVHNLSIEALQELVLEFAPEHFRKEVTIQKEVQKGNTQKIEKAFQNAAIKLNRLFDGELYGIDDFEEKSEHALAKLRPFWKTLPTKITDELVNFIEQVDEAFENSQLYDDYGDGSYEGKNFSIYVGDFIGAIPNHERKDAIHRILDAKGNMNHGCFDDIASNIAEMIPINDLPQFANLALEIDYFSYLNGKNGLKLYNRLQLYLTDNQKEQLLSEQSADAYFNLTFAKYYESKSKYSKAYKVLSNFLDKQKNNFFHFYSNRNTIKDEQFQMIIRLCEEKLKGKNTLQWIEKYNEVESSLLSFQTAIRYRPERRADFENYFKEHHINMYAQILETENRLNQVVQLFKKYEPNFRSGSTIYEFFQRHKTHFPDDATIVFKKELEIYSKEANSRHYEKVREILTELKPILPPNEFSAIILAIKSKYYRRTSLMGILKREGF